MFFSLQNRHLLQTTKRLLSDLFYIWWKYCYIVWPFALNKRQLRPNVTYIILQVFYKNLAHNNTFKRCYFTEICSFLANTTCNFSKAAKNTSNCHPSEAALDLNSVFISKASAKVRYVFQIYKTLKYFHCNIELLQEVTKYKKQRVLHFRYKVTFFYYTSIPVILYNRLMF